MPRSFFARRLAAGGELGHRAARRRLRGLAAGVRVDLGVEHEDVDVAAGGEHVVEAAEADVVGPAVAADDPDALADEGVGERRAGRCAVGRVDRRRAASSARPRARAGRRSRPRRPASASSRAARQVVAELGRRGVAAACGVDLLVDGEPHAEAELGVVLEQRVRPGRAAAVARSRVHGVVGRLPP